MQSFFPDPMCPNQNVRDFPDVITFYGKIHKKPLSYYFSFLPDCKSRNRLRPTPDRARIDLIVGILTLAYFF